jgi:hypothetical protein
MQALERENGMNEQRFPAAKVGMIAGISCGLTLVACGAVGAALYWAWVNIFKPI